MGLMRFSLDGIVAFRNKDQHGRVRHLCVDCARDAREGYTLIPFLDDQLNVTLSDFGKDLGSMMWCDKCSQVISTYYPETFWTSHKTVEAGDHTSLILKKF
jgi:hypothetical protein